MKRWIQFWPVALGAVLTGPLFYLVALLAGGGRGSYLPATILFPVGMWISMLVHRVPYVAIAVAAVQFPLYAYWFVKAHKKWLFVKWLLLTHILLIFIAFLFDDGGVFIP